MARTGNGAIGDDLVDHRVDLRSTGPSLKQWLWFGLVASMAFLLFVASFDDGGVATDGERVQQLSESFACPECAGQSVAESNAARSSSSLSTRRMPRPPPPAVALIMSGNPIDFAFSTRVSRSTGPSLHAVTGTFAASAMRFDVILSPSMRIVAALGPRNTRSAASSFSTNDGSSARNPQPGHTASTCVARRAASTRS